MAKKFIPNQYFKGIKRIMRNQHGSVTYVSRYPRYDIKQEKEVVNTSKLLTRIGKDAFYKLNKKTGEIELKTPYEVYEMLHATMHDLNASYMIIG